MTEEQEILEALKVIKESAPKLHLYVAASILSRVEKGTSRIKVIEARKTLGSIFHVNKQSQLKILKELETYQLLIRSNRKEYIVPFSREEYEELFNESPWDIKDFATDVMSYSKPLPNLEEYVKTVI